MPEAKGFESALEGDTWASEPRGSKAGMDGLSRRTFLGVGSAGLAGAALASLAVNTQEKANTEKADHDHSASNPGPENKPLLDENPNSNFPPPTDHGHIEPIVRRILTPARSFANCIGILTLLNGSTTLPVRGA
jgi:hypothetical protein